MQMSSLYSGWAGIQSHSQGISSVADNLANQSTTGFKSTRPEFHDIISSNLAQDNSVNSRQVGHGSYVDTQYIMSQGSITTTDNPLDMAISGGGFFILKQGVRATPGGPETGSKGDKLYSRDGAFTLNANGYIVNSQGYVLQGYMASGGTTVTAGTLTDIRINTSQSSGATTSRVDLSMNLNAADTDTHSQATAIDPNDKSTYNYVYTTTVYDRLGEPHNLTTYYQHLTSYSGDAPTGSAHVWKAATFEDDEGTISPNPINPGNVYYLHFDTDGKIVGTSTASGGAGDAYYFTAGVNSSGSYVSNQMGEELTFTGAGTAQTYRTTASVTFSGAGAIAGDSVTIGGDTYTFTGALNATASANWLAEQINGDPSLDYYASALNGVVTLRSKGGQAFNISESGNNVSANDNTTMNAVISAINNGVAATGAIDLTSMAAGDTVTVGTTTFTQGVDFTDAASLAGSINAAFLGVSASSNGGNGVFLTASSAGTAGNSLALAGGGGIEVSSATLLGGLDGGGATMITASAYAVGGSTHLRLARSDVGTTATITLPTANTLGDGMTLDFDTSTQTSVAAAASGGAETSGQVSLAHTFGANSQTIVWDYTPDAASDSTQSAGSNEVIYLYQNGSPAGELQGLSVDENGFIHGSYSNGQDLILAGVALSTFKSPGELQRRGDNLWSITTEAGTAVEGLPGDSVKGLGVIEGAALENSNVDLATEFVRMINYQRAYQANSKSISTSDEMLKEAINLKR